MPRSTTVTHEIQCPNFLVNHAPLCNPAPMYSEHYYPYNKKMKINKHMLSNINTPTRNHSEKDIFNLNPMQCYLPNEPPKLCNQPKQGEEGNTGTPGAPPDPPSSALRATRLEPPPLLPLPLQTPAECTCSPHVANLPSETPPRLTDSTLGSSLTTSPPQPPRTAPWCRSEESLPLHLRFTGTSPASPALRNETLNSRSAIIAYTSDGSRIQM
jgi:hypothetical protein